jgi:L-lactate dehydrogenase (cytochrome)
MASTRDWFETVAEARRRARRRLPRSVYLAVLAGAEAGVTMNDNVKAFSELWFRPHVAGLPAARGLATTVMGQEVSLPVLISPTGVQAVHPDGEVAVARAAAGAGTAMGLSKRSARPRTSCSSSATGRAAATTSWPGRSGPGRPAPRASSSPSTGCSARVVTGAPPGSRSTWTCRPWSGTSRRSR